MREWIETHFGWVIAAVFVLLIALFIVSDHYERRAIDKQCTEWMYLAITKADSLQAGIACQHMKDQYRLRLAIGAAAGVVAGSNSGRH